MGNLVRRIRGSIGMGVTWGLAWFAGGVALWLAGARADVPFPLGFGLLGFFAGTTFSVVLGLLGGNRRFEQLSIPRFALWGAAGGLILCGLFVGVTVLLGETGPLSVAPLLGGIFATAGAGCAAGSLALARRSKGPEALESRPDPRRVEAPVGRSEVLSPADRVDEA